MPRTVGIGHQDFEKLRMKNNFYIDKTDFIRKWWDADDEVTLITRPRRFGKTMTMSMVEKFFLSIMPKEGSWNYSLILTNREVHVMFSKRYRQL